MFNLDGFESAREQWLNSRTLEQLERLYDGAWMSNNTENMRRYAARIDELKAKKDDTDLIAAALGLGKASAWAKATVHITEPEFNFAINGEQVKKAE
jgi:hypothetical protein